MECKSQFNKTHFQEEMVIYNKITIPEIFHNLHVYLCLLSKSVSKCTINAIGVLRTGNATGDTELSTSRWSCSSNLPSPSKNILEPGLRGRCCHH